jgi:hypothetical protein
LLDAAVEVGGVWALFFLALEADALEELLVLWVFKDVMTERSGSNVEIIPDMNEWGSGVVVGERNKLIEAGPW